MQVLLTRRQVCANLPSCSIDTRSGLSYIHRCKDGGTISQSTDVGEGGVEYLGNFFYAGYLNQFMCKDRRVTIGVQVFLSEDQFDPFQNGRNNQSC